MQSCIKTSQQLLPSICHISDEFNFQQVTAQAHRAHETISFLRRKTAFVTPDLWPLISSDLTPVDCKLIGIIQQATRRKCE